MAVNLCNTKQKAFDYLYYKVAQLGYEKTYFTGKNFRRIDCKARKEKKAKKGRFR